MSGRLLFRKGLHFSRRGRSGPSVDSRKVHAELLPFLGRVETADLWMLVREIGIVRAYTKNHFPLPTRKDVLAQLGAMTRIQSDEELLVAVAHCDQRSFELIQQATIDAISKEISATGKFIDTEGVVCLMPPAIEMNVSPPYFPAGPAGVRKAIALALEREQFICDSPGAKGKQYQTDLGCACVYLWKKYRPELSQKIWRTLGTARRSGLVGFSAVIFSMSGIEISDSRLVALLRNTCRSN